MKNLKELTKNERLKRAIFGLSDGEYYPCNPYIFEKTYEKLENETNN